MLCANMMESFIIKDSMAKTNLDEIDVVAALGQQGESTLLLVPPIAPEKLSNNQSTVKAG